MAQGLKRVREAVKPLLQGSLRYTSNEVAEQSAAPSKFLYLPPLAGFSPHSYALTPFKPTFAVVHKGGKLLLRLTMADTKGH